MPSFKSVAVIGAGAWGTALAGVAARAGRDVVLCARNADSAKQIAATRDQSETAGRNARCRDRGHRRYRASRHRRHHPDRDAGAESARGGGRARAASRQGKTLDRLRQGHRARHASIHDRGDRGHCARCDAGDPVGPRLCRRRRARPSDRRDLGGQGRDACRPRWCRRWARRPSGPITPPTSGASRSAAQPRTCWRSPRASRSAENSARPRWRR